MRGLGRGRGSGAAGQGDAHPGGDHRGGRDRHGHRPCTVHARAAGAPLAFALRLLCLLHQGACPCCMPSPVACLGVAPVCVDVQGIERHQDERPFAAGACAVCAETCSQEYACGCACGSSSACMRKGGTGSSGEPRPWPRAGTLHGQPGGRPHRGCRPRSRCCWRSSGMSPGFGQRRL